MSKIIDSFYNIRILDEIAEKDTVIHKIHPLMKVFTTFVFLITAVSFGKYELSGLIPLIFYPITIMALAEIPAIPILKRMIIVMPFIICIGAFNPFFDTNTIVIFSDITISAGWVSFVSLLLKGIMTILAAFILIATTGMTKIAFSLRLMRVPQIFVMQLLLTYRYISVLIEELARILRGYSLRSPYDKGIRFSSWGPLTGQLLLRTITRAQRVYQSMCCRGFVGEFNTGSEQRFYIKDIGYFISWSVFFIVVRYFDISNLIGTLMTGVGK
ncbi:MAG: cobalt ABC transporter permease [Desulfitibacter sp. BRH_c19]|nr:MAG: cobalt ABC transporter permease [Desulfitibacter sp. BRH_c19]